MQAMHLRAIVPRTMHIHPSIGSTPRLISSRTECPSSDQSGPSPSPTITKHLATIRLHRHLSISLSKVSLAGPGAHSAFTGTFPSSLVAGPAHQGQRDIPRRRPLRVQPSYTTSPTFTHYQSNLHLFIHTIQLLPSAGWRRPPLPNLRTTPPVPNTRQATYA